MGRPLPILFSISFFLFAALSLLSGSPLPVQDSPEIHKGLLDLRGYSISGRVIPLQGEWEFHQSCFLNPLSSSIETETTRKPCEGEKENSPEFYPLPGLWSQKDGVNPNGFASYRLRILSDSSGNVGLRVAEMYSAYTLYWNGEPVTQNGRPATDPEMEVPFWLPVTKIVTLHPGLNEVVIHLSSFHHRKGGIWSGIDLGDPETIIARHEMYLGIEFFLLGSLLMMGIYHAGLYTLRRDEKTSLLFGLFSLVAALRVAMTGERLILLAFPLLPYNFSLRVEYATVFLSAPLFFSYFYSAFPSLRLKRIESIFWGIAVGSLFATIILPETLFTYLAFPYQLLIGVAALLIFYSMIPGMRREVEGVWIAFVGFLPLVLATVSSVLYNNDIQLSAIFIPEIAFPVGVLWFIFAQSYLLASRFTKAYQGVEDLTVKLAQTSRSYSRFVPVEFMRLLKKRNITEVKPGDQVRMDITILFLDIRNFTGLSETMTPEENFAFINAFLKRMSPSIHENGGFIDKFMGDSIMAIFPGFPDDALEAAVKMQKALGEYNRARVKKGWSDIHAGIGVHTGSMILGMVGTDRRMDGSVISDAVNVGSRVEKLTRFFNSPVLFTLDSLIAMQTPERYKSRIIGRVHVKGKNEIVPVVELLDVIEKPDLFLKTVTEFEEALAAFHIEEIGKALDLFQHVLRENPQDRAAQMYVGICEKALSTSNEPIELNLRPE